MSQGGSEFIRGVVFTNSKEFRISFISSYFTVFGVSFMERFDAKLYSGI